MREKELAIMLRKRGNSYRDILKRLPVAKSTLSEWLKEIPLSQDEKRALKRRKDSNISHGRAKAAAVLHMRRLERDKILLQEAREEYHVFKNESLFRLGIALYWAEGSKRSPGFAFANSDPDMINLMLTWIDQFFRQSRHDTKMRLYIHKPYAQENCERYWHSKIGVPLKNFQRTIYKPTGLLIKKRPNYKGCLRVYIDKISFLRKMLFWQNMLIEEYRKR